MAGQLLVAERAGRLHQDPGRTWTSVEVFSPDDFYDNQLREADVSPAPARRPRAMPNRKGGRFGPVSRRRVRIWCTAVTLVLLVVTVIVVLPGLMVTRDADGLDLTGVQRVTAVNQVRTTLLQALGAAVLLVGLTATWRQLEITREGQVTERFTRAVEHLGSTDIDVRTGGIYALERIARDSPADRDTVTEVLAAFVRHHAPWPPPADARKQDGGGSQPLPKLQTRAVDVHAAMTVLGRARWRNLATALQLNDVDLRVAYLPDADLRGAYLHDSQLEHARLPRAVLRGANLGRANLGFALLRDADLEGADLHDARLEGADLRRARLDGVNLGTEEREAAGGASLEGADLRGARLGGTRLAGTRLRAAKGDSTTVWPSAFDPVNAGVIVEQELPAS
jgi:hypothetical protein